MKYRTLALVAALSFFAGAALANDKDITVKTDKFTGKTTVLMNRVEIKSAPFGCCPLIYLQAMEQDGQISFVFISTSLEWEFLHGADVHVLADGKQIDLGHFARGDGEVGTSFVTEYLAAKVDRAALEQMANASDLEIEIGQYQCKVKAKNARRLKAFADATRQVTASK